MSNLLFHLVLISWIVVMLTLAQYRFHSYAQVLREDGPIEWATVWLFGAAGIIQLCKAVSRRRYFDLLIAVFCLFVACEEFSWGQRLFGYASPQYFVTHNYQQELNFHNLPGAVVSPKWFLIAVLGGYGVVLPLLARSGRVAETLKRIGATPPPFQLMIWFSLSIVLLIWYPFALSGEWIELLTGCLFVATMPLNSRATWSLLVVAVFFGLFMTGVSMRIERNRISNAIGDSLLTGIIQRTLVTEMVRTRNLAAASIHKISSPATNLQ